MYKIFLLLVMPFFIKSYETENYINYHQKFSEIETLIVEERFKEAQAEMEQLFNKYEVKFVKDYVIACQIALLNKDQEKSLFWLKKAIRKGVTLDCLKEIDIIRDQIKPKDWKLIELEYKILRKSYLSRIDLELLTNLSKRYTEEQEGKRTNLYPEIVQSNFKYIKQLIKQKKYPGESRAGIDNEKLAPSISSCDFGNSMVTVTLLHYDHPISEIGEPTLIECIKSGDLHPREFAIIYTFEKNKVSILYRKSTKEVEPLNDYKFNFPFGSKHDNIRRVNMDRELFGICKYQVDKKKEEIENKFGLKLRFNYR